MKVFLLNSLVVHELVSMHLEGKWLTPEQFTESATLWIFRHAPDIQLSEKTITELQLAALQIAKDLMKEVQESPLTCLFLEIPDVNYANPLSTKAFSASLNVCREKLCGYGLSRGEKKEVAKMRCSTDELRCDPALRLLVCGAKTPGNCAPGNCGARGELLARDVSPRLG
jgi:hypothetical protein